MASANLRDWICERLKSILDFPDIDEIVGYILGLENARDLEDYLKELLDTGNLKHQQFIKELLLKRQCGGNLPSNVQVYKKSDVTEDYVPEKAEKKRKDKDARKNQQASQVVVEPVQAKEESPDSAKNNKKKTKYLPLYSPEGLSRDVVLLSGRHACECQASKHRLVNNCLKCGRIVCDQEGSGPCLFCGELVYTQEEREILARGSKKSESLLHKLMAKSGGGSAANNKLDAAMQQRNKLLEYDKTSEKRTRVIDDDSDYFTTSKWLPADEREKLQKREEELRAKKHTSRLERLFTLDFAGRRVLEEQSDVDVYNADDPILKQITDRVADLYKCNDSGRSRRLSEIDSLTNPNVNWPRLKYEPSEDDELARMSSRDSDRSRNSFRIQDRELQQMTDTGSCLSMHQPWASLLVAGIKQHEGRNWYTPHRGRLWIAAASKEVTPQEIKESEHAYRVLTGKDNLKFPAHYPVSCLLGCVEVVDCLPQEEYREKYPDGESLSPFVFVCENFQELPVKFPVSGKHKIYKLDSKIHQAAQKSLQRIAQLRAGARTV